MSAVNGHDNSSLAQAVIVSAHPAQLQRVMDVSSKCYVMPSWYRFSNADANVVSAVFCVESRNDRSFRMSGTAGRLCKGL